MAYVTTTAYDPTTGNVISTTAADGTITQYTYNATNQLEQVCQDSAGLNLCTQYDYDRHGRQEFVTDAEDIVQQTVYNRLGMPVQEIADVNGLAATLTFTYDDLLNLVGVTDANGNETRYTYTNRGALETELYADGTFIQHSYSPRGNLAATTLQDGAIISRTYDAANRQIRLDFSTGGFQAFSYDTASRMTQATQTMDGHTSITAYGYDAIGSVITTSQKLDSIAPWLTQYSYDYGQGVRTVTYPSGKVLTYTLDTMNRLDSVDDSANGLIAGYDYDIFNHVNELAYNNGLTNQTDYDPLGRVLQMQVISNSTALVDYGYGYDKVGNRTYMQRNHRSGLADVYQYDGLYQLVNVWYGADATDPSNITSQNITQTYNLDALGNRLTVSEDSTTTNYGPHNGSQLTNAMNQYDEVEGAYLGYDQRGNVLADPNNVYTYDILNRQTTVSNTVVTEYLYDARGRRIAKIQGSDITHFIYDTSYRVIEERDSNQLLVATYTYGQGMDEPLTMERGGETYYYHRDALGSITEVSDNTGSIVERYEYDVYGAVTIFDGSYVTQTSSTIGNPYLFTGRRFDPESGNYYYRARVYSPNLGRFLSMDPLGFAAGDYNLYRYVFNNPVNGTDPTGEFAFLPWLLKASAEAAVDALMQGIIHYYFNPNVNSIDEAIAEIDIRQVGWAFVTGFLPGSRWVSSAAGALGDVLLNYLDALENCQEYTPEQALRDFTISLGVEIIGSYVGDWVAEYGTKAVASGLRRLGFDDLAEKVLRQLDEFLPTRYNISFFQKFARGQGFSTAVDLGNSRAALSPSTRDIVTEQIRDGVRWVPRAGGHRFVRDDLLEQGAQQENIWGLAVEWNGTGLDVISWSSGVLNSRRPGDSRELPLHLRPQVIEVLRQVTGLDVVDVTQ